MSGYGASGGMTPAAFIAKWRPVQLPERAASQEHFLDLCRMLGQPTPAQLDATGAEYTFEKGVAVTAPASKGSKGAGGFADVWWRGKFGWEYKRKDKHKDLTEAYRQLCQYREALENPPLLIVCDIARTEIHTNFTNAPVVVHTIFLERLDHPENLGVLRRVFTDPQSFRPDVTTETVTKDVAEQFALLSQSLQRRGHDPHAAAHFLMKCMFCLFAEDVGLLPANLFTRLLGQWKDQPKRLPALLTELFDRMRTGGAFGAEPIAHFNGGLFDEAPALALTGPEIGEMLVAAKQEWSSVEPSIFGTLFERSLDPSKRAQIGAHYTSRDDILLVIEPVIMAPLRREWDGVQEKVEEQLARRRKAKTTRTKHDADQRISQVLREFLGRLGSMRILDPACGSGNFLYVAIQQLLYLEKDVIRYAARPEIGLGGLLPTVRPTQLHGIEINPYAAELAQVVIWIGYLQWMRDNGFLPPRDPILEPLQTIECRDAILDLTDPHDPKPADWPAADFIVGNPPFLGSKLFRQYGLPEDYIEGMYAAYDIPNSSDLCCYWFERARMAIEDPGNSGGRGFGRGKFGVGPFGGVSAHGGPDYLRVGLLATQGIRGGANRAVLERIKETGDIFSAWSDRNWILDGAAVHVSIVGFDGGSQQTRILDDGPIAQINADLTGDVDTSVARHLAGNAGVGYIGMCKKGKFELRWAEALTGLRARGNPNGRPNSDVLRPWYNGIDLVQRYGGAWIIDFGVSTRMEAASQYEWAFGLVVQRVQPKRDRVRNRAERENWWRLARPVPDLREAVSGLTRLLATPTLAKHRIFCWLRPDVLPSHQTTVFARDDDYFLGVLHSSVHELWALRQGTQLETRPRYTPTTCFETFPLPWAPGEEPEGDPLSQRISAAAKTLDEQRERWVNPPEWIEPIARNVDAMDDFVDVPADARPLIRRSAIQAMAATDEQLKQRTLTNLYNRRPTWLKLAHRELDAAVLAAYAATDPDGDWREDWADVWFDTGAGQPLPEAHRLADRRAETDQNVLANLLRMNLARAGAAE